MKLNFYLLLILLFTACKKSNVAYNDEYIRSYKAWTAFKASSGNNYRYMASNMGWNLVTSETIITIQDGKPVARSFKVTARQGTPAQTVVLGEWKEDLSTLNTHDGGFRAQTLDEIYQQARTDWLIKRANTTTYFETKNNGMISTCGYVVNGCADGCFNGISIGFIEKL